jgi:hypothetical protein
MIRERDGYDYSDDKNFVGLRMFGGDGIILLTAQNDVFIEIPFPRFTLNGVLVAAC